MRNLDLTALRSFVAVADAGGVTRAAARVNLTQSAVSMQLKRLEESVGVALLDRSARSVSLSTAGEQLLGYARRMLALNDDALARLTADEFEGEITLGVPHDIVTRYLPRVLHQYNARFPRMRVRLVSSYTRTLLDRFERGEVDMILTTEDRRSAEAETLCSVPLVWVGAPQGQAWKQRPIPIAFEQHCIFRVAVQTALDVAGLPWKLAINSDNTRAIEATVGADMAVHALMGGVAPHDMAPIKHDGALPDLPTFFINFYVQQSLSGPAHMALADLVRQVYGAFTEDPIPSQSPSPWPLALPEDRDPPARARVELHG